MEEETSWKGHSFTMLVFTGIVVLCSIFFILGMLVGRDQGQKLAVAASALAAAKAEAKLLPKEESKPYLTFYDSVKRTEPALEPPPPLKIEPVVPHPPKLPNPHLSHSAPHPPPPPPP